jgi:hypothetical protein
MFERPHHQRILRVLHALDGDLLERAHCYFGGGTAIVLALGEYRESVGIDFLCADREGYRLIRSAVAPPTLGSVARAPLEYAREVRTERAKIYTRVLVDDVPIKVEFVLEARIDLAGARDPQLRVPVLDRADMYAEKLLATADRGLDRGTWGRDLIDLGMMLLHWGPIPDAAWRKTEGAYGPGIRASFDKALALLERDGMLAQSMQQMHMDAALGEDLLAALRAAR